MLPTQSTAKREMWSMRYKPMAEAFKFTSLASSADSLRYVPYTLKPLFRYCNANCRPRPRFAPTTRTVRCILLYALMVHCFADLFWVGAYGRRCWDNLLPRGGKARLKRRGCPSMTLRPLHCLTMPRLFHPKIVPTLHSIQLKWLHAIVQ